MHIKSRVDASNLSWYDTHAPQAKYINQSRTIIDAVWPDIPNFPKWLQMSSLAVTKIPYLHRCSYGGESDREYISTYVTLPEMLPFHTMRI